MNNKEKIEKKKTKDYKNNNKNKEKILKDQQYKKNKELIYENLQLIIKEIKNRPIISILISMSIGYILGFLTSKKK